MPGLFVTLKSNSTKHDLVTSARMLGIRACSPRCASVLPLGKEVLQGTVPQKERERININAFEITHRFSYAR